MKIEVLERFLKKGSSKWRLSNSFSISVSYADAIEKVIQYINIKHAKNLEYPTIRIECLPRPFWACLQVRTSSSASRFPVIVVERKKKDLMSYWKDSPMNLKENILLLNPWNSFARKILAYKMEINYWKEKNV